MTATVYAHIAYTLLLVGWVVYAGYKWGSKAKAIVEAVKQVK